MKAELMAHLCLTQPAYSTTKPGTLWRATREAAVSCQALSPFSSQAGAAEVMRLLFDILPKPRSYIEEGKKEGSWQQRRAQSTENAVASVHIRSVWGCSGSRVFFFSFPCKVPKNAKLPIPRNMVSNARSWWSAAAWYRIRLQP